MEKDITQEEWFHDPFSWYENTHDQQVISLQLSENTAIDILRGLHEIYLCVLDQDDKAAIDNLEVMATIIIAKILGYGDQVIEELLVSAINDNMDEMIQELMEGNDNE